jgi:phytoene dehydrogenase-like protein
VGAVAAEPDAIAVGGGHNWLVAAAYLARAGLRPLVLEGRDNTRGAARTETPWGPNFKVTALSHVVSLMPAQIIADLGLAQYGCLVVPMGPTCVPFPDGRSITLTEDPAADHAELSNVSKKDAAAMPLYRAWLKGVPTCSRRSSFAPGQRPATPISACRSSAASTNGRPPPTGVVA